MVLNNKKFLLLIPLAMSCSGNSNNVNTSLVPMTSANITVNNTIVDSRPLNEMAYIDDLYYYYKHSFIEFSNTDLITIGHTWCDLMDQGMKSESIVSRINEGSSNQEEADLQIAIINSAVINFCPNNQNEWRK